MKHLQGTPRAAFVFVCEQIAPNGLAVVSTQRIADQIGCSRRQAIRVVDRLIDEKWIWIEVDATPHSPPAYGAVDMPESLFRRGDILACQNVTPKSRSEHDSWPHLFPLRERGGGGASSARPAATRVLEVIHPDELMAYASARIHYLNGHDP